MASGKEATAGWPTSAGLEAARAEWLAAPDLPAQQRAAAALQRAAFDDLPYIPTGQLFTPVAYRADLTGMLSGLPAFWNVRRS